MKILNIINNLGAGGAEKLLQDLTPLMNKLNNIEVDILLLTNENNVFSDSLIEKGIKVDVIKYRNMYDPRNIIEIKKLIISGGYDVVHSHNFPTQYWVGISKLITRNKDIRFITTEHNTHNRRRERFYFRPIDKFIFAQYDTVVSITEKTKINLLNWLGLKHTNNEKYIVIENGVNIEKIKQALPYKRKEALEGIDKNTRLVCMVGRFSEQKDQPTLIKAISKLPEKVHLILVGIGPLIDSGKELVNNLEISDRVHFLGFREDIPRILKTVDIVVLSSHWEGFGLAAVEGMAAGKPVIASNVDGLAEVVKGAGLLFPKGNSIKLAENIQTLLNNEEEYEQVKDACIKRAEDYSIDRMVEDYYKLLTNDTN